ncbi:NTP transferase domain-containing protein [Arthrobacter sp. NPDC090010]|uniref:NTP transferase domain-containing protein n=1 Tax=Arthrobacter sp. NPDC090010 TaxID=3363942 RepID=UPI00381B76BD
MTTDAGTSGAATRRAAIILAGGRATRLGGTDKASVEVHGKALVDHVLTAVERCAPLLVVGPSGLRRPGVTVVREDPPFGGPVAAVAAGLARLARAEAVPEEIWLLSCDLPRAVGLVGLLEHETLAADCDAVLPVDDDGRVQWLAGRYRVTALQAALAGLPTVDGAAFRQLAQRLRIRTVPDPQRLSLDLDTWAAVEQYRGETRETMERSPEMSTAPEGLDDWVTEVSTALDLDGVEVPTSLLLELTRDAAHGVTRPAGPLTTYLVGIAVARGATPEQAAETVRELIRNRPH